MSWLDRILRRDVDRNRLRTRGGANALTRWRANYVNGIGGSLLTGGLANAKTGLGGPSDNNESNYWVPTLNVQRSELETIYNESWACGAFIDYPVDDMMIRWRTFKAPVPDMVHAMTQQELRHSVVERLGNAMKAGRLYGTGLLCIMTREAPLHEPFMPEYLRPGDLTNLLVTSRYEAQVIVKDREPMSPTFGQPEIYEVSPKDGRRFRIHTSRVLRFDGRRPLTSDSHSVYDADWGVSEVIPALIAISQDQAVASSSGHLVHEASIPIIKVDGLRDSIAFGGNSPDNPSLDEIGDRINESKSNFHMLMMDKAEDFERVGIMFSGLHEIMDQMARRLAAAAGIPATRFWGQSPIGLNATGDSDMANYALHVGAMQERFLTGPLQHLDLVLSRDIGLPAPLEYEWRSMLDTGDAEQAATSAQKIGAIGAAVQGAIIDEDEARMMLDGDATFGSLPGPAPELPPVDMSTLVSMAQAEQSASQAESQQAADADKADKDRDAKSKADKEKAAASKKPAAAKGKS